MRADRLVAILLMLQRRTQVTAGEVAEELEISERTARRDLDALSMAGVPVYSQQGRGGGWRLAGGGQIDLSGLTAAEARALFLVAGPSASAKPEVRSALRKLVRALPEPLRLPAEAAADAVVEDPFGWDRAPGQRRRPPFLDAVEAATVDGEALQIGHTGQSGEPTHRVVHPLGLATKGRWWYLVGNTTAGLRTFRVDRIISAERTGEPVERPAGFELSEEWARIVERVDRLRTPVTAKATAVPESLTYLRVVFGSKLTVFDNLPTADDALVNIEIGGSSARAIAAELAGFGAWVTVSEPEELRDILGRLGRELAGLYS